MGVPMPLDIPVLMEILSGGADRPALDLNLAGGILDSRVAFTGNNVRTYRGPAGLMLTAGTNIPRFEYDVNGNPLGLKVEGARTNLQIHSAALDNAAYVQVRLTGVTADQAVGPDGTTTLDELIEDATAAQTHYIRDEYVAATLTTDAVYALSYFVRANTRTKCHLFMTTKASSGANFAFFDLSAGTNTSTTGGIIDAGIEDWGGGLYRVWATINVGTGATTVLMGLGLGVVDDAEAYNGDGTSSIYAGFAQLEEGTFPSSYVATAASAVARTADVPTMTDLGWYNDGGASTFAVEGDVSYLVTGERRVLEIGSDSTTDRLIIQRKSSSAKASTQLVNTSVNQFVLEDASDYTADVARKTGVAYAPNDSIAYFDGTATTPDTSVSIPSGFSKLFIGHGKEGASTYLYGHIKRIRYWPRRLTDNDIDAYTT